MMWNTELPSYKATPDRFKSGYFWRWLRGGVWLVSIYGWVRHTDYQKIKNLFWLRDRGFHVEDHRWYF